MFLNVSALPVLTITLRENIIKLVSKEMAARKEIELTWQSVILTLAIMGTCFVTAFVLRENISLVVNFTGGICGVIIMMIIPSTMIIKARSMLDE